MIGSKERSSQHTGRDDLGDKFPRRLSPLSGFNGSIFLGNNVVFNNGGGGKSDGESWWVDDSNNIRGDRQAYYRELAENRQKRDDGKYELVTANQKELPIEDQQISEIHGHRCIRYKRGGKWGRYQRIYTPPNTD